MIRFFPLLLLAAAPPPPPVIASFQSGPVRCGDGERVPVRHLAPLPVAVRLAGPVAPVRFRFRIDAEGRPLGIGQAGAAADPQLDVRDLAPALAAWRFAAREAAACEVSFAVRLDSIETADDALLYRYAALNRMQVPGSNGGALVGQAFARLRLPGSTCVPDPRPREPIVLRTRAIPEVPGGISYSFFSYDVDASGRPVHIRLLSSSGNRALDLQGDVTLGRARFPARPRSGCLYYFYRYSTENVPPPPAPPTADFQPASMRCEDDVPRRVGQLFRMRFPIEFTRRPAEGWAIFTFDVAASGELRNVRIVASEPAAGFGEEVLRAATGVRLADVAGPQRGCVSRVRFLLPGD
jgi:hypothetical protein